MAKKYARPRGTQDILPAESWKWLYLEETLRRIVRCFGYREMRLPTFEHTEVFARSVGESTDIVSKEMYTFTDKGGRSVTLRPEGTAGTVRATLENGLLSSAPLPLKSYYLQSCFRYEKAQKGRLREFHQLGIECFGTHDPAADVETMAVADAFWQALGVGDAITLQINSIGCPECRAKYHERLVAHFEAHYDELCETCRVRLKTNPMRILDCKEEKCQAIAKGAPVMLDYLCGDCRKHFEGVQELLRDRGIDFTINPRIVRGLDYYTNTVYEFIAAGVGTQGTVCGGGRYDRLIEQMGGQPTPAVGFGMGIERLLMLIEEQGALPDEPGGPLLYAVGADEAGRKLAAALAAALRKSGLAAEHDIAGRSLKAQMKAADKLNAQYIVVVGEAEAAGGKAKLKNLADSSEREVELERLAEILGAI